MYISPRNQLQTELKLTTIEKSLKCNLHYFAGILDHHRQEI